MRYRQRRSSRLQKPPDASAVEAPCASKLNQLRRPLRADVPATVCTGTDRHRAGRAAGLFRAGFRRTAQAAWRCLHQAGQMIIAPVIFLTIVNGVAGMTQLGSVGRVFGKAMAYFLFFSTLALVIGMLVAHAVQPGAGMNINPAELDMSAVNDYAQKAHELTLTGFVLDIIPGTMAGAFVSGNILQVLFIAVLSGIALALVGDRGKPVLGLLEALALVVFKLVHILMKAAPIGAFGAIAFTIGKYGVASLINLAWLVGAFYVSSLLFVLVVLGAVARLCGFSVIKLARYLKAELLLVLGTSSSESALPLLMEKMEKAGCGKSVVGLVVPTGYSFNLDGTNIY
ncbi:MAG TPA: cation:dicarboxylase symporter family transporter, partial [Pseudoxanthomonas sp.]|nr:cation:dicarboxylase symporter family transporter [Pseudoxanthomonas sp.]